MRDRKLFVDAKLVEVVHSEEVDHHGTITVPSLHHHCTITTPSLYPGVEWKFEKDYDAECASDDDGEDEFDEHTDWGSFLLACEKTCTCGRGDRCVVKTMNIRRCYTCHCIKHSFMPDHELCICDG